MKKISYIILLLIFVTSSANAADSKLTAELLSSLKRAHATQDRFIISSVVKAVKVQSPESLASIDVYMMSLKKNASQQAAVAELANIAPAAGGDKPWKGSVELGALLETGNTEKENLNGAAKLTYLIDEWENILKLKAVTSKENDARNSEEYRINNQARFNRSERDYVFGELEYVNDRFSGFEYRISELAGYGYHLIKEDDMKLSAEGSLGARQTSIANGASENSLLGKVGGDFEWDINNNFSFIQELDISIASDATITESETAVKSKLTKDLYLKVSFGVEHISDVPAGNENTDTVTAVKVGYDF